uniref:Ribosomal protein L20 n=1 Tax=Gastroclonium compressum TaxID=1852973 RepID=A0A173FZS3_GASCM|nr:ribosomal protein L20 [Coeloseira compressa]
MSLYFFKKLQSKKTLNIFSNHKLLYYFLKQENIFLNKHLLYYIYLKEQGCFFIYLYWFKIFYNK